LVALYVSVHYIELKKELGNKVTHGLRLGSALVRSYYTIIVISIISTWGKGLYKLYNVMFVQCKL